MLKCIYTSWWFAGGKIVVAPINLYALSRVEDEATFNLFEKAYSRKIASSVIQEREIESLRILVDWLIESGIDIEALDGFYYSYKIPQIGKEFDLLKFKDSACLNIELKSEPVSEEKIRKQLLQNRHYLSHLDLELYNFTVETKTLTCYTLNEDNSLIICKAKDVIEKIQEFLIYDQGIDINSFFRVSQYLVSPFNTPDKFLNDEYFLNSGQEEIKKSILEKSQTNEFTYFSVLGKPGTGKTLLLYDIAKKLALVEKTLIIHCAKLTDGQVEIGRKIKNLDILPASQIDAGFEFKEYKFILVDETHRWYKNQFEKLVSEIKVGEQICVFSADPEQTLSHAEEARDIVGAVDKLSKLKMYKLSDKIRTNIELASFIYTLMNLNRPVPEDITFNNVDILYANNVEEAKLLIDNYRKKDYTFINYSLSNYFESHFEQYDGDYDTHHVIGLEFDNVLMVLDDTFYYDDSNVLRGVEHPNPDYIYTKLLYQGLSRVREKLALVVVDNEQLLQKILSFIK